MARKPEVRTVIKDGEEPVAIEILQSAIVAIAAHIKKLRFSRLKEETIARLISWQSGVGIVEVRKVFETMGDLEDLLLKPKKS